MKKKITAIALVVCLLAVAVVGGTLAYFTDTDDATNTFTVGNVEIELIEQQSNADGTKFVPFEQDKVLMPIVGSAQGATKPNGQPAAENYVDKIITVKNTGASKAYVRVFVAVPATLQNGDIPNAPAKDVLHFNWNRASEDAGEWTAEEVVAANEMVNGVACRIYSRTYTTALEADAVTKTPAYIGFYLDKGVDKNANGDYTVDFGNGPQVINYDLSKGVSIPVFAQAVQADGFASAQEAFSASGLEAVNPWA